MKKSRLNSKERATLREMGDEVLQLQHDWQRRLRNALLSMTSSDPNWMIWVERKIDMESMSLQEVTRMVEARARSLVLKGYRYLDRQHIGNLIFRDDWTFTDRGHLGPG